MSAWLNLVGFVLIAVCIIILPQGGAQTTYIVDDDNGDWADYHNIQDAINGSSIGDSIRVFEGSYYEDIAIDVSINIIGNGTSKTLLNGTGSNNVIEVLTDSVTISGFFITGMGSDDSGVNTNSDADSLHIDNCSINGSGDQGVYCVSDVDSPVVDNCTFENTTNGLVLALASSAEVKRCNFVDNEHGGIWLSTTNYHTIRWCNFSRCGFQLSGSRKENFDTHTIENCFVNGMPVYYYANRDDIVVPSGAGQVILASTTDSMIKNQSLEHCTVGVELAFCENISIEDSSIGNMYMSIGINRCSQTFIRSSILFNTSEDTVHISWAKGLIVENCTFWTNFDTWSSGIGSGATPRITVNNSNFFGYQHAGIHTGSNRLLVRDCQFNNSKTGVKIGGGTSHELIGNNFFENEKSITLAYCTYVNVTNNTIRNGSGPSFTGHGIYLWWNPAYVNITYNEIYCNSNYGVYVDSADHYSIHHNNFLNNGGIDSQAYDKDGDGTWDDGVSEGNYWSDWNGTGNYSIDGSADAVDRYPLGNAVNTSAPEKIPEFQILPTIAIITTVVLAVFRRRRPSLPGLRG